MVGKSGAYRLVPGAWPQVRRSQLEVAALDTAPGCLRLRTRAVLREWGFASLPGVEDFPGTNARWIDRFRPAPGPVTPELRWATGKVVWCEFLRAVHASAAS